MEGFSVNFQSSVGILGLVSTASGDLDILPPPTLPLVFYTSRIFLAAFQDSPAYYRVLLKFKALL